MSGSREVKLEQVPFIFGFGAAGPSSAIVLMIAIILAVCLWQGLGRTGATFAIAASMAGVALAS